MAPFWPPKAGSGFQGTGFSPRGAKDVKMSYLLRFCKGIEQ
jgi:hypothetical protein